jgi:hypothetical protein
MTGVRNPPLNPVMAEPPYSTALRCLPILVCFFVMLQTASGQDQEGKLIDRLLRPNMELKNDAQNKNFTADRRPISKQAVVGSYYVEQKTRPRRYAGSRDFSSWEYNAQSYNDRKQRADLSSRNQILSSHSRYSTGMAMGLRSTHDANKLKSSREYAGERQFLDKGKSQKSLSQQNRPLTIEEVRELLNKNK